MIIDVLIIISYVLAGIILVLMGVVLIMCVLDIVGSVSILMMTLVMDALDNLKRKLVKIWRG